MNARPEVVRLARQWADLAEEDYKNAKHTITMKEDCPLRTVCFHAQQCVEKYLKALLVLCSVEFPKTHDLVELINLVPGGNITGVSTEDLAMLNRYAVEIRYPGDWEIVTRKEAEETIAVARDLREKIRQALQKLS